MINRLITATCITFLMVLTGCERPVRDASTLGPHTLTIVDSSGKPYGGSTGTHRDDVAGTVTHSFESANGRYKIKLVDKVLTINGEKYTLNKTPSVIRIVEEKVEINGVEAAPDDGSNVELEDGGQVENADRNKAEAYFVALCKVRSVEEEKTLLTEFGEWLSTNDYKINVVEKNGKHELSCPYFPPVTPWTNHTFHDIKNLELLPQ